jgi:hypothetical protein
VFCVVSYVDLFDLYFFFDLSSKYRLLKLVMRFNLATGEIGEAVVGGANAIRYMADGLYASENIVVAHGDHMYVINGQFMEQNAPIRSDYQALVESIRFIPAPGQN